MSKILINSTSGTQVINDVGISLTGFQSYTIPPVDYWLWASSSDVITKIGSGIVLVSDGSSNLSISDGTDLIKGIFPSNLNVELSEVGSNKVDFKPPMKDAFGRLRTSAGQTIFDMVFLESELDHDLTSSSVSGASVTWSQNISSMVLETTSSPGSRAIMQTRKYIPYHPGKSQLVKLAGNMKGVVSGIKKLFGQFDENNGFYFCIDQDGHVCVGLRSKVTGSVVDTHIDQADWNTDKLDGTGISGITLDLSKQQIFIIDYQWQGSGQIRFGVSIDGDLYYCHIIYNANRKTTPYSQTATLPLRMELHNVSGDQAASMHATCLVVESEGGWGPEGELRTVNTGTTSINLSLLNTRKPVISIRKQSAYYYVPVHIMDIGAFAATSDEFLLEVVLNGTLSGASWSNVDGYCQKDVSANSISGGRVIYSTYLRGTSQSSSAVDIDVLSKVSDFMLGAGLDHSSDIISLVSTNLSLTASIRGAINYREMI